LDSGQHTDPNLADKRQEKARPEGEPAVRHFPQHFLNFLPLPHGHGSLRPILGEASTGFGSSDDLGFPV
jgi:hypothetical protein